MTGNCFGCSVPVYRVSSHEPTMRDSALNAERLRDPAIPLDRAAIADFCRRSGILRLALFGSVLRSDFGPESDVDVLVQFGPDAHVGLFRFVGLQNELARILGRRVDLRTPDCLSRYFRDEVLATAEPIYAAAG